MVGKITKKLVDELGAEALVWDRAVRGFAVRRQAGGAATYLLKYRTASRRQRWLTIGPHGSPWTADAARAEALQLVAAVARGEDPAGTRQRAREGATMHALFDRFISDHVDAKLRATTAREYKRLIAATLRPALGHIPVAAVSADDIARLHQRMKSTPTLANRAVVVVAKILAMAERWGMRPLNSNPARGIEKYREVKRTRRLSLEEVQRLGTVLALADVGPIDVPGRRGTTTPYTVSAFALAAIKLLMFTGARKSEILTATWDMVDASRAVLHLPDSKTGAKDILLPVPALAVLDGLVRLEGNPYILPGARDGTAAREHREALAAILSVAKLEGVTLHVLRHSFASIGVDAGLSLPVVGRLLGTARQHDAEVRAVQDPVRAAAELVAGRIAAAMGGA